MTKAAESTTVETPETDVEETSENGATANEESTEKATVTPKDKIQQLLDKKLSSKQAGYVQWVKDQHGFAIDPETLRVVQATYGPLYRKSAEYAEIAENVRSEAEERKSARSVEALATKSPEEKAKALAAAEAAEKRLMEKIAKIKAMVSEANADGDSDVDEDDVSDEDAEF